MGTEKKWNLMEPADPEKVGRLAAELGIDRVLADLLVKRGIETFDQARSFFRPSLSDLHDPFLMTDMDKAVERLHKAITSGEKILVLGLFRDSCVPSDPPYLQQTAGQRYRISAGYEPARG